MHHGVERMAAPTSECSKHAVIAIGCRFSRCNIVTSSGCAVAMGCEPLVCAAEDGTRARNKGQSIKRPAPPNVLGQKNQRVSAGKMAAIRCENAHGIEELTFRYTEALTNPRRLKGSEVETAARKNRF